MTTPYKTPRRPLAHRQPQSLKNTKKAKAVDLVTGKAVVEYYFDPALVMQDMNESASNFETPYKKSQSSRNLGKNGDDEVLYSSKHLYVPCTIIKRLEDDNNNNAGNGKTNNTEPYDGPTLVKTVDGTLHKIYDSSKLQALSAPDDYVGMDDILHLPHVTEASLLHTLRTRYKMDDIYTSAGPILISINPYRTVSLPDGQSLYSEELMMKYRDTTDISGEKPPHLFQVADRAYVAMMDSVHPSMDYKHMDDEDVDLLTELHVPSGKARNQSIIISGESGAGKTEATKYIMKYLARITKKRGNSNNPMMSPDGKMIAALEDRVLSSNPLLETFGNAQTLRNDNSSRFGKFINIFFSTSTGSITGASISNYLLEKTRITHQVEGERNYHIFYQLLASTDSPLLEGLGLEGGSCKFNYLGNRDSDKSVINDADDFANTCECLTQIGISQEDQKALFGLVAGVLHLGNVQFEEKGEDGEPGHSEHAKVQDGSLASFKKACELLGMKEEDVSDAILTKNITVGGKTIKKAQTVANAAEKRDALSKLTYSSIFLWLVTCVNETLDKTSHVAQSPSKRRRDLIAKISDGNNDDTVFIGVLDIYGFECFQENGYEQLLINYCNEKLQRQFNENVFTVEQNLYSAEGIDWTYITFNDNRPCLDLIEGGNGTVGVLNTLDDAWGGMGNAAEKDIKFVNQLHKQYGNAIGTEMKKERADEGNTSHDYFVTPKFGNDNQFIIVHFAGEVRYTVDGFVEKNMETLSTELRSLGDDSSISLAQSVFSCSTGGSAGGGLSSPKRTSIRGISVGSQFRSSLQILVADLEKTQPHYIRCIKPNLHKAPNAFSSGEVLKQLRYSGMMEAIRIRREGYALREDHESFYNRFSVLLGQDEMDSGSGIEHLVKVLSKRLSVTDADWQIGHSKIFLRRELSDKLEKLATLRVHRAVRTIGRFGRMVCFRRVLRLLVPWMKFRLHMLQFYRRQGAADKITATYRSHTQVRRYRTIVFGIVKVQALRRRKAACARVELLRDPYSGMTYKDVKRILATEQANLESAVKEKDFKLAAELEAKIAELNEVVDQKKPLTRSALEEKITKAEKEFADALANKNYTACDPLQKKVDELVAKRIELPTLDELKVALRVAEEAVAAAAASRNFSGAAEAQASVKEAKRRLDDALAMENGFDSDNEANEVETNSEEKDLEGIDSRAQLEQQIAEIRSSVESAIAAKDFKEASALQEALDKKEALRKFFPSLQEMEENLISKKKELSLVIENKDFARAGELHELIDRLEESIKVERVRTKDCPTLTDATTGAAAIAPDGKSKTFETRADLEDEISATASEVSKAVASKNFQKAQELNTYTETLENLRKILPTVPELEKKLRSTRKDFEDAVAQKDFSKADMINKTVEELEEKLQKEQEKLPKDSVPRAGKQSSATSKPVVVASSKGKGQPVIVAQKSQKGLAAKRAPQPRVSAFPSFDDNQSVKSMPVAKMGGRSDDSMSVHSLPASKAMKSQSNKRHSSARPVSKLRPKKAHLSSTTDTILSVTKELASNRGDASLIVDKDGALCGIVTDVDITRRVVAKSINAGTTEISVVMTPNPTCVAATDPALDALTIMIENHFRHLPVVDTSGSVVGLLDIAKCLNDAIGKLEKSEAKGNSMAEDTVKQVLGDGSAGDAHALALQALLGQVMAKAFGDQTSPTLRSLLKDKPTTIVSPTASIQEAGKLMAESRKAALVVEEGKLLGIFGFKDMMTRAVAKDLPLSSTAVSTCMTENPEFVSPDMTVLEALQTMHDQRFLTLPVCTGEGDVLGVVDVIDVINACGGVNGWRSIFSSAMDLDEDDSDAGSVQSFSSARQRSQVQKPRENKMTMLAESADERPVSKLRPKRPLISDSSDSILAVTQMLASKRADATIVVDESGTLAGILTDVDVTRRVVAKFVDPSATSVSEVMTPNPTCVSMSESAMDAMATMVENHFRHLPVLDDSGAVVGLLDIARCLNDAITKLEKSVEKGSSVAEDVVKQVVGQQGTGSSQALALQALLGQVMAQAFGNEATPTLASLLAGQAAPTATVVSPNMSVKEVGLLMAEHRKAALIVEDGELVGCYTFKDMMTRVVAKGLSPDSVIVSDVMTASPESVPGTMTVLEAMQVMHDNRFLTLPVSDERGRVLGVVSVMDLINACGGEKGWRSIFSQTMEMDDCSDAASVFSHGTASKSRCSTSSRKKKEQVADSKSQVSKLRPKKPLISDCSDTVISVTQMLASKRADAAIVVDKSGTLAGILTDVDVTRRVVAKSLDPSVISAGTVMTPNPTCVSMSDPAMDAMATMVENHFRHLPVLDDSGAVVGVLDIAACLNDAITKLEKSVEKSSSAAEDVVKQVVGQQGAHGSQALALQALLSRVMTQAFGNQSSPTLASLLAGQVAPTATVVPPNMSVKEVGLLMAEHRKAALIVEDGELVGCYTFKDMMTRVVAKGLSPDSVIVSDVMTASPESVPGTMTVLEAMQVMHDNRFLTLPVSDERGRVLGVVSVMELINACGGEKGWRSIFSQTMEMDDASESCSVVSTESRSQSAKNSTAGRLSARGKEDDLRTVAKLRPGKAIVSCEIDSVLAVAELLTSKRSDSTVIVGPNGNLRGILTDVDVTRRVVAKYMDPSATSVSEVMTPEPTCVSVSDSAMDAMAMMVENHFRHLPVLDDSGAVVGVLEIGKCLNDAISKLEKSVEKSSSAAEDMIKNVVGQQPSGNSHDAALQALLSQVMAKAFGNQASPTLANLLAGNAAATATTVSPDTSVREAGLLMAEHRKAALIVEDGKLTGIFGFRDLMTRVVAKGLSPDSTIIEDVMTASPESVASSMTVLEAMQVMHDNRFLTLPVCDEEDRVLGVVDVMDLILACGGKDGWRSIFSNALDCASFSDDRSAVDSHVGSLPKISTKAPVRAMARSPVMATTSPLPNGVPATLEFRSLGDDTSTINDTRVESKSIQDSAFGLSEAENHCVFKVVDPKGNTHRIRSELSVTKLMGTLIEKGVAKEIQLQFVDDEGDTIVVSSDNCLAEAAALSRSQGNKVVKLTAKAVEPSGNSALGIAAGLGLVLAAAGALAFFMFAKPRK